MAEANTQKKTSLEPSEVFCALGLLIPNKKIDELCKDNTGEKLLQWSAKDGLALSKKIKALDPKFTKMIQAAGKPFTDKKKRSDLVANMVAGFSGAKGVKEYMAVMRSKVDIVTAVYMTGATWPTEVDKFRLKAKGKNFDYNSSDLVVQVGQKKFFGISLKKKPDKNAPDPTIINKAFSTFLEGSEQKNVDALEKLNKVRQDYFADMVRQADKDGIISIRDIKNLSNEQIWNYKLQKPNKNEKVALINLKGFNEKDDPIEISDVDGTVRENTLYDKPTGRLGLKGYINQDLAKDDNKLFKGFTEIIDDNAEFFANKLIDMVLKVRLNTKLAAKDIADFNFEFALVTGYASYKAHRSDPTKDVLTLKPAKYIPLHTVLCGLANLSGNKKPYKILPDKTKQEKADAAKVFYELSRDGVPILDLQLRYKGDFKSMPQFFATITDKFQEQMDEKCLVTKPDKPPKETQILNKTFLAKA